MKKSLLSLLVAVISLQLALPLAYADTPPPKPMTVDGHEGIWFSAESAKRLLKLDEENRKLKEENAKQKRLLDLRLQENAILKTVADSSDQIADLRLEQLGEERMLRLSAEKSRDAWYNSNSLWFSLGSMVATGLILAVK